MERASDREILEVFAFELAWFGKAPGTITREQFLEQWQTKEEVRIAAYARAKELEAELRARGLDLRACNTKKVRDAIQVIITIPAKTAYVLPPTAVIEGSPSPPPVPGSSGL
jgi:hypothetical protein